jgi:hypothetical protein
MRTALVLIIALIAIQGSASGQFTNQITTVGPNSAPAGTVNLTVTFTLETDFPPPPPPGDGPQLVKIGTLTGTSITHTSPSAVTAVFDIPATEPSGPKDVAITFSVPGGSLVFSLAGGFTVGSGEEYNIERTLADGAQRNTIAFDGLGFLTGDLGSQSFLPPGKVADYSGFQYLRDNDPTGLGHNTSFVTIVAFNVLHILTSEQISQLVERAENQVAIINQYAYDRFPLMKAFRRLFDGDVPPGSPGLDPDAVMAYSAELYRIDGAISYDRARLLGGIVRSFTPAQRSAMDALKALNGVGHWDSTLVDPLRDMHLPQDVDVAVMTYASEMYAWYAGSVEADVYFCPERQGTYFGSFYLKDWPAMGNPNYTIDEQLTARAGEEFLAILSDDQEASVTGLVEVQRSDLDEIVDRRGEIATQLRRFMTETAIDSAAVMELSERYGELDGEIVYNYASRFSAVGRSLTVAQRQALADLADSLGYIAPTGAFLYSNPIAMPDIIDTDFLFLLPTTDVEVGDGNSPLPTHLSVRIHPNPATRGAEVKFELPGSGHVRVTVHDAVGRIVAELLDAPLGPGTHHVSWTGVDAEGRRLPAGVYVAQVRTANERRSAKLILAR